MDKGLKELSVKDISPATGPPCSDLNDENQFLKNLVAFLLHDKSRADVKVKAVELAVHCLNGEERYDLDKVFEVADRIVGYITSKDEEDDEYA